MEIGLCCFSINEGYAESLGSNQRGQNQQHIGRPQQNWGWPRNQPPGAEIVLAFITPPAMASALKLAMLRHPLLCRPSPPSIVSPILLASQFHTGSLNCAFQFPVNYSTTAVVSRHKPSQDPSPWTSYARSLSNSLCRDH
jgi:hypothetical protein